MRFGIHKIITVIYIIIVDSFGGSGYTMLGRTPLSRGIIRIFEYGDGFKFQISAATTADIVSICCGRARPACCRAVPGCRVAAVCIGS